ncbi:dTDP-4-dehydrorhamnose reductase [Methanobrevibacter cuticularis]|uniref:dTDP-4-dehydrorhamnose reductase n=1 Tax=Methanobrevibacter cuticularis TaxID=47311 RepID=A0A166DWV5_9EURY|nr:dTDP-4-dehydrorhamnose reductase [Methanobrevibacter cuticularis]KZX16038.1 dTDP-4-dehydrorhamnose reductase [Methanobrevibacter cuticularis]
MKILITGYKGMLGSDLVEELKNENYHDLILTDVEELDITNLGQVKEFLNKEKPEAIINVAAYTDVDGCETNRDLAYNVNSIGPKNLAIIADEINAKLLHISTDYVFSGDNSKPYSEDDKTGPNSYYGETKLQAELFIKKYAKNYFIIRTAWLYGFNGKNFVKTMLELSKNNDQITVVNDQHGSPTFTKDLAIAICELIKTDKYGIYHLTNGDNCTWYEFAKKIFELANVTIDIVPVTTEEYPTPAKRPQYSVLSNEKWKRAEFEPLRSYIDALNSYMGLELNK